MDDNLNPLKKYNFWDGNVPELGYGRTMYTKKVSDYIGNKLIKVLVGQRRVGKSYILRQLANQLIESGVNPSNILYLNKEFIDFDFVNNYHDLESLLHLYLENNKPSGKKYLFIDEIQYIRVQFKLSLSCVFPLICLCCCLFDVSNDLVPLSALVDCP